MVNNLATTYAPILKKVSIGLGGVDFTKEEQAEIRRLTLQLKTIYDQAVRRSLKTAR
ncbi:MAG: hypothetical protein ABSC64_22530 [Candidatus Korobacteraceae bacterium]